MSLSDQPSLRSDHDALFGAICFAMAALVTMLAYFAILTRFEGAYSKATALALVTVFSTVAVAGATRSLGLRITPRSSGVALLVTFAVFFSAWVITTDPGALTCWSCVQHDEHDFRFTNGDAAVLAFVLYAISTACAALAISVGLTLVGRVLR